MKYRKELELASFFPLLGERPRERSELWVRGYNFLLFFLSECGLNNVPSPKSSPQGEDLKMHSHLTPRSYPRRRVSSLENKGHNNAAYILRWIPIVMGMSGVLLVSCSGQKTSTNKTLVCKHKLAGYETMPITMRLFDEILPEKVSKKAEVSYGASPKSATYFEIDARYMVTLPKNDTFPECTITIDRLSGFAKQTCLGISEIYPNDPRSETFELSCKNKIEKL